MKKIISNMLDAFGYIEEKTGRKLSETEKIKIRYAVLVWRYSIQKVFDEIGIDYQDAIIK